MEDGRNKAGGGRKAGRDIAKMKTKMDGGVFAKGRRVEVVEGGREGGRSWRMKIDGTTVKVGRGEGKGEGVMCVCVCVLMGGIWRRV